MSGNPQSVHGSLGGRGDRRQALQWLVALAVAGASFLVAPSIATAGVGTGAVPTFPTAVTAGEPGLKASITLANQNTAPQAGATNTVCNFGDVLPCPAGAPGILLTPSCGQLGLSSVCAPAGADPNVVKVNSPGTGDLGSACAGMVFDIVLIDPVLGQWRFTPQGGAHVVLPGNGALCRVNFAFDALKVPALDFSPTTAGVQTVQIVENTQTSGPELTAFARGTSDAMTIAKAGPNIATVASPGVRLGGSITDSATVSGLVSPVAGATVTFNLYGPLDASCAAAPVFTSVVALAPGGTATSAPFTPAGPGVFRWIATYNGDANNNAVSGVCAEASEAVTVAKANPAIATVASPSVRVGGSITDSATVSGLVSPVAGATVAFNLYSPSNTTCAGAPVFTSVVVLSAAGTATSAPFTPTVPGVFRWIASYSGDANNNPVSGVCAEASEAVTVIPPKANPTIATLASPSVPAGGSITDSATVSGLVSPVAGATVTFNLYAPSDATCSAAPVFTSVVALAADGTAVSAPFTPTVLGVFRWIASYSGDDNNNPVSGACAEATEVVNVTKANPTINTLASVSVQLGGSITDSATVSGLVNPVAGATVTFNIYAPSDTACAGAPVFTSVVALSASGTATSAPYQPTVSGIFRWIATYNGDANNNAVSGSCAEVTEAVNVSPASTSSRPPSPTLPSTGNSAGTQSLFASLLVLGGLSLLRLARRRQPRAAT
jgi:hypothetical protein